MRRGAKMELKNFQDLIDKRFSKKEIEEIERQAELEAKAYLSHRCLIKKARCAYSCRTWTAFVEK